MPSKIRTIPSRVATLPTRVSMGQAAGQVNYGQGRGGRPWRRIRDRILKRDNGLCVPCRKEGRLTVATEVDHVIGRAQGGSDTDGNLQAICTPCHKAKTQREAHGGIA